MEVEELELTVAKIKPILAGLEPRMQSAILAALLALWIVGHSVAEDAEETWRLRTQLLTQHAQLVAQLVKLYSK
jgi:hypothetical protein